MLDDVLAAPFVQEMVHITREMYNHGWDERNGGNISLLLSPEELAPYSCCLHVQRELPLGFCAPALAGRTLLVTGTGKYFKNVSADPAAHLGIIRISPTGDTASLLWGFSGGGTYTSELPAHLASHAQRLARDAQHRVIMHCHPTNILAMTFVHSLDEREFTRSLWRMCTECMMVFPDGIAVLPWMMCGTESIGQATAEKMKESRLVVWAQHGIYAAGKCLDEAFGLIETVEKAAAVYMKIAHLTCINTISDEQLLEIATSYGVCPRAGYLNI